MVIFFIINTRTASTSAAATAEVPAAIT